MTQTTSVTPVSRVDRDNMEDTDIDSSEHDMLTLYVRNVSMSLV